MNLKFIPPSDPVRESGDLRIEYNDERGVSHVLIISSDALDEESRRATELFAYAAESAGRLQEYWRRYPLAEGDHNYEQIRLEQREDLDDFYLRSRRGRERYSGLDAAAVAAFRSRH